MPGDLPPIVLGVWEQRAMPSSRWAKLGLSHAGTHPWSMGIMWVAQITFLPWL